MTPITSYVSIMGATLTFNLHCVKSINIKSVRFRLLYVKHTLYIMHASCLFLGSVATVSISI